MRIASNHVRSVSRFFRDELNGLYEPGEIEEFIFYSFAGILGYSRSELSLNAETTITESELLKLNAIVKRLKKQEPIQYILQEAWFFGMKLKVSPAVLIPRPETEELVEWILKNGNASRTKKAASERLKILDIGTGSGCIAIALKKQIAEAEVFALDISTDALDMAKQNAELNSVLVNFIEADILSKSGLAADLGRQDVNGFDLIVSNPPYVPESEKKSLRSNVLHFEPHRALFVADDDPLLFYRKISEFAKAMLRPGGSLFFEVNESKGTEIADLLRLEGFSTVEVKKDINGKDRMIRAVKKHRI